MDQFLKEYIMVNCLYAAFVVCGIGAMCFGSRVDQTLLVPFGLLNFLVINWIGDEIAIWATRRKKELRKFNDEDLGSH